MLFGFVLACGYGGALANVDVGKHMQRLSGWLGPRAEPNVPQALVITVDLRDQLALVATLSPRGFHPLLASSELEVLMQIRAHPGTLKLAVVDAGLPDYAVIARALNDALPAGSIIVLKNPHRLEDVGPMMLDRL